MSLSPPLRSVGQCRNRGGRRWPRTAWIETRAAALVSEEVFALAQERLEKNKYHLGSVRWIGICRKECLSTRASRLLLEAFAAKMEFTVR